MVQTRIRAPEIEDDEVIENTPEIQKLVSNLDHNSQNVGAGNSIEVTPKQQADVLQKEKEKRKKKKEKRKKKKEKCGGDCNLSVKLFSVSFLR